MVFSLWKSNRLWKFIFLFCVCYFLEAITFTYLISAVQSMERQFQIPSQLSGTLVASSDIGYIPTVIILAHFGSKGNRPRWIGFGCLLISLACLVISLPGLTIPPAEFGSGSQSLNASTLESTIPKPPLLYSEIDTPSKLASHAHVGCAFSEWLLQSGLPLPNWAKVDDERWSRNSCPSSNQSTALRFINNSSFWDDLTPQLKDNVDYEIFAKVLVDKVNAAQNYPYAEKLATKNFASLLKQSKRPQALCSRLVNHFRALIKSSQCATKETNALAFTIVILGVIAIGVGHSMPWSLGMPLIDDSVKRSNMPYYVGGVFFIRILGPMLGFLLGSVCNRLYYNLKADPEVEPTDVNWIGAWWLGFLAIAVVLFIPSLMLFFFPHVELTSLENKPDQSSSTVAVQQKRSVTVKAVSDRKPLSVCSSIAAELKILFESLWLMIRLPVYTLCMIGRMLDVLAFKGFFVFHSKYLQAHYSLPQYKANAAMGLAGSFGFALGNVAGGVIMRKMKLEGRRAVVYVLVCGVISVLFSFVKLTLGCTSTLSQLGSLGRENGFNFTTSCNRHCHCDNSMLLPVCSSSGTPYFSPCHAGCQSSQRVGSLTNFTDCFCMDNGTIASRDFCRDDCDQPLVSYLLLWTVTGIIAGTAMVPGLLIVLRSVPARLKSLSLGFNAFLVSLLSTLPSPILYGYVIDGTCLFYFSLHGGLRALAVLLDIAVFYFAKDLKILEDSNVKKAKSAPSITDSSDDVRKTSTHSEQRQEAETKDSNGSLQQPEQKAPNSCCTNLLRLRTFKPQYIPYLTSMPSYRCALMTRQAVQHFFSLLLFLSFTVRQLKSSQPRTYRNDLTNLGHLQELYIDLSLVTNGKTFSINLFVENNIVWHLRAYYDQRMWVADSFLKRRWQNQREIPMESSIQDRRVKVSLRIQQGIVIATIANQVICDTRPLPDQPVDTVEIRGEVASVNKFIEKPSRYCSSRYLLFQFCFIQRHATGRCLLLSRQRKGEQEFGTSCSKKSARSSSDVKCEFAGSLVTLCYLPLPWEATFTPLISIQIVEIELAIQPDPVTSVINLYVGHDIAWHFRGYYVLKGWVMNSNVDGIWQAERRVPMKFCVVPGKRINVRIVIEPHKVRVFFLFTFDRRDATFDNQTINDVRDLIGQPISHVTVAHDVILYKIKSYNIGREHKGKLFQQRTDLLNNDPLLTSLFPRRFAYCC
ncbi:hypothetical protein M513_11145, partial [Trichuris suis]